MAAKNSRPSGERADSEGRSLRDVRHAAGQSLAFPAGVSAAIRSEPLRPADGDVRMDAVANTVTIDEALDAFLAEQRERLSPKTLRNYEDVVSLLRRSLNGYAYESLDERERKRWETAFEDGDEQAFTK